MNHLPYILAIVVFSASPTRAADTHLPACDVVGDGKADDSAAIQKTVDSGSGTLHFARGTYRLTQTIVVDLDKVGFTSFVGGGTARLVMAGAGLAFKRRWSHPTLKKAMALPVASCSLHCSAARRIVPVAFAKLKPLFNSQ